MIFVLFVIFVVGISRCSWWLIGVKIVIVGECCLNCVCLVILRCRL